MSAPLLGAHVPARGGVVTAPGNGQAIGATAIQVFTRNHRQWACKPLAPGEPAAFRKALAGSGVRAVMAHASYLINLASISPDFLARSRQHLAVGDAVYVPHLEAVDEQPVEAREIVGSLFEGGDMHLLPIARHRAREVHGILHP